jgi:hypothetical protein
MLVSGWEDQGFLMHREPGSESSDTKLGYFRGGKRPGRTLEIEFAGYIWKIKLCSSRGWDSKPLANIAAQVRDPTSRFGHQEHREPDIVTLTSRARFSYRAEFCPRHLPPVEQ